MLLPTAQSMIPAADPLGAEGVLPAPSVPEAPPPRWVTDEVDEEVEKSERLLEEYAAVQEPWAIRARANDEFRNGLQWKAADYDYLAGQHRPTPVINVLAPAVEQAKAMLTSNRPRFDVAPRGDEDRKAALVRSVYLSYVWDMSDGNVLFDRVVDDYYVQNRGVWFAFWDPSADGGRGGVRACALDPLSVFPDPNSRDPHWKDASNIITARPMTRAQIGDLWAHFVEELDGEGKARIDYASEYDFSRETYTGSAGSYGAPYVGDNGQRASYGGVPMQDHLGKPPIGDVANHYGGGTDAEHERYEVISRFTKVRVPSHTVYDPATGEEMAFDDAAFNAYVREAAFIVSGSTGSGEDAEQVYASGDDLDRAEALYELLTGQDPVGGAPLVYHLREGALEVDAATGELVPGAPVPVAGPEPFAEGVIPGSTRVLAPVPKGMLIERGDLEHAAYREERWMEVCSIGGVRNYEHLWPVDRCPVVPVPNRHNRNPYPSGDLDDVRPLQEQLNYTESQILHHLANSRGDLVFVPRGVGIDKERLEEVANMPGRHILEYDADLDGGIPIHSISPSPLAGEMFGRKRELKDEIREILGLYEFQQGGGTGGHETATGLLNADEFGQRRIRRKAADHEHALSLLGSVVLQLAAAYETERKVIRLTQPHPAQAESEVVQGGGIVVNDLVRDEFGRAVEHVNDLGVGRFDVRVIAGSTLYDNKIAMEQRHLEYFQAGIIDDVEVLKQVALYDTDGVLKRKGLMQQAQQMIAALQEEVQSLSGDMQTKDRELETADRRVADQKYQKRLAMLEADAKTDVRVASKRIGDIVQQTEREVKEETQPSA